MHSEPVLFLRKKVWLSPVRDKPPKLVVSMALSGKKVVGYVYRSPKGYVRHWVTTPPAKAGGFSLHGQLHEHEDFASHHD